MLDFPQLPGNDITVTWRPIFSTSIQTHESGAEYRLAYWARPLWEWDISFNFLRQHFNTKAGHDDLGKIVGLFLASYGSTFGFRYFHKDDNVVFRQLIGITDGATSSFTLVRTFGQDNQALGLVGTEPIGFLDTTKHNAIYFDDSATPLEPANATFPYALDLDTPVNQQIVFTAPPEAGHEIYADMNYLYYARFKESSQDFDKFGQALWALQKVTLRSLRAENIA